MDVGEHGFQQVGLQPGGPTRLLDGAVLSVDAPQGSWKRRAPAAHPSLYLTVPNPSGLRVSRAGVGLAWLVGDVSAEEMELQGQTSVTVEQLTAPGLISHTIGE